MNLFHVKKFIFEIFNFIDVDILMYINFIVLANSLLTTSKMSF